MIHHRYYVGMVTRDGRPVPASSLDACTDLLIRVYGGYSLFVARGAWRDADGVIKREPSRVYECISDESAVDVTTIARRLAYLADQTTVLWTAEEVEGGFS